MMTRATADLAGTDSTPADLAHHGDADLVPGLIDLAVNVRSSGTPAWLAALIRDTDVAAYPDQRAAVDAVAARHGRASEEVLLTAGAAEAFADCLPGERESLASHPDLTGIVVIRSLTKTWVLAGLRAGYVLGAPDMIAQLASGQPPWPVSAPALTACIATASPAALREADALATALAGERAYLLTQLAKLESIRVVPGSSASFVLLGTGIEDVRTRLHANGFAVRRGETFPGLAPGWIRVAVRDVATSDRFALALREVASNA